LSTVKTLVCKTHFINIMNDAQKPSSNNSSKRLFQSRSGAFLTTVTLGSCHKNMSKSIAFKLSKLTQKIMNEHF
jgi:hypothetical protein